MLRPGIWGSHVELLAAATYFQVPIYILKENQYVWEVLKPLGPPQNFKYQLLPEIDIEAEDFRLPHHIELLHSNNCHYDSLISTAGCTSSSPPNIPEIHYDYTYIRSRLIKPHSSMAYIFLFSCHILISLGSW